MRDYQKLGGILVLNDLDVFETEQKQFLVQIEKRKKKHRSMSYQELYGFIKQHGAFYRTLGHLEGKNIFVIELQEFILPFKTTGGGIPMWWDVYNSLNHDKYEARERSNLEVSLHCLAAMYRLTTYAHKEDSYPLFFAVSPTSKFL
jgi:hypothetical protein